jgi:hypothetical protein
VALNTITITLTSQLLANYFTMHMQWLYNQITMNKSGFKVEIQTALMENRKYVDGMIPA